GEPGKGDALAHPRIGIACRAVQLAAGDSRRERIRRRYLNRNPKAKLYAELGDFHFFRLEMLGANLNGGFARAYRLTADQLRSSVPDGLADLEQSALDHMNGDHADAVHLYAEVLARLGGKGWKLCGIDADGLDLVSADATGRVFYPGVLESTDALRPMLALMAREARAARD
ncbi:pyridoxamine 5'-phosphate oxidase, partial [Salmonella enterica subsp. enterica serovar Typhi]|nr:pyridoxamine 5'-phosphate oxidase [Salmonella enterica subsp. enterica serovar Typhi]